MGERYYITLFSPSDVTAFHRMKYGGGGVIYCFHRVTSLRFTELQPRLLLDVISWTVNTPFFFIF